jgi:hypothetical protein
MGTAENLKLPELENRTQEENNAGFWDVMACS